VTRVQVGVLLFFMLWFAGFFFGVLVDVPDAVVCGRAAPNIEVASTRNGVHLEEHRIGPCVTYAQKGLPSED
jgi:hypothetical protein